MTISMAMLNIPLEGEEEKVTLNEEINQA